jgi:hypothetical protein
VIALRDPYSFQSVVPQAAQRATQCATPLSVGTLTNSCSPCRTLIALNSISAWCANGPPVSRWQRVQWQQCTNIGSGSNR